VGTKLTVVESRKVKKEDATQYVPCWPVVRARWRLGWHERGDGRRKMKSFAYYSLLAVVLCVVSSVSLIGGGSEQQSPVFPGYGRTRPSTGAAARVCAEEIARLERFAERLAESRRQLEDTTFGPGIEKADAIRDIEVCDRQHRQFFFAQRGLLSSILQRLCREYRQHAETPDFCMHGVGLAGLKDGLAKFQLPTAGAEERELTNARQRTAFAVRLRAMMVNDLQKQERRVQRRIAWLRSTPARCLEVPLPSNGEFLAGPFNTRVLVDRNPVTYMPEIKAGIGGLAGDTIVYYPYVARQEGPTCSWNALDNLLAVDRLSSRLAGEEGEANFKFLQAAERSTRRMREEGDKGELEPEDWKSGRYALYKQVSAFLGAIMWDELDRLQERAQDVCVLAFAHADEPFTSVRESLAKQAMKRKREDRDPFDEQLGSRPEAWQELAPGPVGRRGEEILRYYARSIGLHGPVVYLKQRAFLSRNFTITGTVLPRGNEEPSLHQLLDQMRAGDLGQINFYISLLVSRIAGHAVVASLVKVLGIARPFIVWIDSGNNSIVSRNLGMTLPDRDWRGDIVLAILDRMAEYVETGQLPLCGPGITCCPRG